MKYDESSYGPPQVPTIVKQSYGFFFKILLVALAFSGIATVFGVIPQQYKEYKEKQEARRAQLETCENIYRTSLVQAGSNVGMVEIAKMNYADCKRE